MSVFASTSDQIVLSLLWKIRNIDKYTIQDLADTIHEFQTETGAILYGSVIAYRDGDVEHQRNTLYAHLCNDIESLEKRQLIERYDGNCLRVTLLAAPVANSVILPTPFPYLEDIVRKKFGGCWSDEIQL